MEKLENINSQLKRNFEFVRIRIQTLSLENKLIITGAVIILITLTVRSLMTPKAQNLTRLPPVSTGVQSIADVIPAGSVLVPISVINQESLESLMGAYGLVDIYTAPRGKQPAKRIAKAVKLIRSPQNEHHFAAIVPEEMAGSLIQTQSSFFVTVISQNEKQMTELEKSQPLKKIQISYQE